MHTSAPMTTIQRRQGWAALDLRELWRRRELAWILALRDIRVRYKQTVVGALWAVLQPFMMMVVFSVLFWLLGFTPGTGNVPYPITLYCALLPWQLFANAVSQSGESLVVNQQLITKVYFPRIIIPLAPVLAGLVDFGVALVLLVAMMIAFAVVPGWPILLLPVFIALAVLASLAFGLWLSALNVLYRDFRYVLPFVIQVGFFASPVFYETASLNLKPHYLFVYALNPMVGVIEGFRWSLLGNPMPSPALVFVPSLVAVAALFVGGMMYFRRVERTFADWV